MAQTEALVHSLHNNHTPCSGYKNESIEWVWGMIFLSGSLKGSKQQFVFVFFLPGLELLKVLFMMDESSVVLPKVAAGTVKQSFPEVAGKTVQY